MFIETLKEVFCMRVKIKFDVIGGLDNPDKYNRVPNATLHALLMNRLPHEFAKESHKKGNKHCLFTFSSTKIDPNTKIGHFIFSSLDKTVEDLIVSLRMDTMFRLGKYVCKLTDIELKEEPDVSNGSVLVRGKLLGSTSDRSRVIRDKEELTELLEDVANHKLYKLGLEPNIKISLFKIKDTTSYYEFDGKEEVHFPATYIIANVEGDPESLKTLMKIGMGQNTGTGNGLMWEVS